MSNSTKFVTQSLVLLGFLCACSQSSAGVTLMNADRQEYAVSIKCKADVEPLDDIIEINGLLDLESGPCTVKLKSTNQVVTATDGEIIEIRSGKIGLQ
jgi:hypothetical protein